MNIKATLLAAIALPFCVCAQDAATTTNTDTATMSTTNKTLVAYFSWSGNTKAAAQYIAKKTGADLFEIVPEKPYPTDYKPCTEVAKAEKEAEARPAIKGRVENLDQYDTVFVGAPVWRYTGPMPLFTFLEGHDLKGKTVVPFCTAYSGPSATLDDIVKATPGSDHKDGLCIVTQELAGKGMEDKHPQIDEWLKKIGVGVPPAEPAFGDEGPTLVPNALGLVYEDAISENRPGEVNLRRVEYQVDGIAVAANVYLPADYDPAGSRAAVVVAHPNGGSKDQVAGLYAQRLAEAGLVTLAFDARYQGESGGEPRRTDKPANRIGDILGAVDFIQNFPGVDPERVGAFGICGGGGYTFAAAQTDKRIRAVATLSLFNTGDVRRNGYMRTQAATRAERQREAALARQREAAGAEPEVLGFADMTPDEARKIPVDLYREGYFYYGVTHKTPNAPGTYLKSSLMDMMAWDATDHADLIDQPLLVIAGDRADSLYMSQEAFAKATGTADKELFLVPGATHIKTYYVPEYTAAIAAKLRDFFERALATAPSDIDR